MGSMATIYRSSRVRDLPVICFRITMMNLPCELIMMSNNENKVRHLGDWVEAA